MSDRSDTVTTESKSTEQVLAETEQLLEGTAGSEESDGSHDQPKTERENTRSTDAENEPRRSLGSRLPTVGSVDGSYFSPKAFLALVLAFGAAMLVGTTIVPVVSLLGGALGLFGTAFLAGLATSKRRYLEVATAGTGVGALMTLLSSPLAALLTSPTTFAAFGASIGLLTGMLGYYFGRDLRDGLSREL